MLMNYRDTKIELLTNFSILDTARINFLEHSSLVRDLISILPMILSHSN